jgi:hypothetical protein
MKKYVCLLLLALLSQSAFAYSPASGMWWNPAESGRGYNIDVQNGTMVVTAYVYTSSGTATWFLAAGPYDNATSTFTTSLNAFSGGQCFGCSYSNPTSMGGGPLSIVFTSPETATMTFPGGSTQIQHEIYGYANKTDYFLGEWAFTLNTSGLLSTQWVVFNGHYTGSDGTVYASGQEDGVSGTAALGLYDAADNVFIVAIADNVGYSFEYLFQEGDDRRMLGLGTIYSSGTTPPQPTEISSGSRLLFPAELSSGTAPAKVASAPPTADSRVEALAQSMQDLAWRHNAAHP